MRFAVKARKIGKIVIKRRDDGMAVFEGAGVALITPFKDNGEINYEKLEEILEEQIAGG